MATIYGGAEGVGSLLRLGNPAFKKCPQSQKTPDPVWQLVPEIFGRHGLAPRSHDVDPSPNVVIRRPDASKGESLPLLPDGEGAAAVGVVRVLRLAHATPAPQEYNRALV
jgi:hypothetical protein